MAYTQADLDALRAAKASGAKSTRFGAGPDSREVEWRTLAELNAIEAEIMAALAGSLAPAAPIVTLARFSRD